MPLIDPAAVALDGLSRLERFTGDDDLVFPNPMGEPFDASGLRRRFALALSAVGLRRLRFHEYADLLVMPTLPRRFCSGRFFLSRCRHNQSASRKARSVSGGW